MLRPRALAVALATAAAVLALVAAALFTGDVSLPNGRVLAALAGDGTRIEHLLVVEHRLARALSGVLVGAALGCAGALTQSVTRNPIASPDILGVTAGASLFAVLLVTRPQLASRTGDQAAAELLASAAVSGGLLTAVCILLLSWRGGLDGMRIVLVGLSFHALALAGVSWLLTRAELEEAQVATRWLTGSLAGVRMSDVTLLGPLVLCALATCAVLARDLDALRLGRETAPTLGTSPVRTEAVALLVAVLLVSVATAVAGPVAFVAFVAPQAAMRAFGTAGPPPLAGALTGALLVLGADTAAQRLPVELPVGVPTAVLGAPFLLFLLNRHRRRTSV
ncbi:FecCD family ABC transporter permease [Streptomyces nanshensis]|uniref:FecCD family ABC transporter permease n=1 Tax=Streptomyces nanshensis TaxID=518642 RepID=UPI001C0D27C5|nr:iron ABC transporter permease [Streptomyces nanshensis]